MKAEEIKIRLLLKMQEQGYKIAENTPLLEQIDSLQIVDLLNLIEETFQIDFESYEVHDTNFKSLEHLSLIIQKKIVEQSQS